MTTWAGRWDPGFGNGGMGGEMGFLVMGPLKRLTDLTGRGAVSYKLRKKRKKKDNNKTSNPTKIRAKTRMPTLAISIQYNTRSSS